MEFVPIIYSIIYISLLVTPLVITYKVRERFSGFAGFGISVCLSSIFMSGVVVALWLGNDWYLDIQIAELDRDGDGFYSDRETETWTSDEKRTMDRYIGDGGRNVFAAIIFPIFSIVYSIFAVSIYCLVSTLRLRYKSA